MRRLSLTVKPQARKAEVKKDPNGGYIVAVQAAAREGKANQAVIELLASHFRVPKACVRIVHGRTGRKKLVEID